MRKVLLKTDNNFFIRNRIAKIYVDTVLTDTFDLSKGQKEIVIKVDAKKITLKIHWWRSNTYDLSLIKEDVNFYLIISSKMQNGLMFVIYASFFLSMLLLFMRNFNIIEVSPYSGAVFLIPMLALLYWQFIGYKDFLSLSAGFRK